MAVIAGTSIRCACASVEQLEEADVIVALVAGPLDERNGAREGVLDDLQRMAGQERTEGGAHDDHDFGRVPEEKHAAPLNEEPPHDASDHDQ
jgi:hypothetical protein